jgi:hypothetical protein
MKLEIKNVKKCRNGAQGNFLIRGHDSALITLSLKLNPTLAEWGSTLLHELLHFWTTLMQQNGMRVTNTREHRFIYAAERAILKVMIKYMKRRK